MLKTTFDQSPRTSSSSGVFQLSLLLSVFAAGTAWSQALPPAGQVNKEAQVVLPGPSSKPVNAAPLPAPRKAGESAASVLVKGFKFTGNTMIKSEELQTLLAPSVNQQYDFAGLDRVVDSVSRYYRAKGYTVARAFLPTQESADGIIQINIIEGRFGAVNLKNSTAITNERLEQTIANNLCSVANNKDCVGKLIEDQGLERAILTIKDLPGVTATANLKPGKDTGTSELDIEVIGTKANAYSLGFDNFGSPATGTTRLNASADLNNLGHRGDLLSLGIATTSMTATKTGSASYTLPLGYAGQRVGISYARSQYRLGAGFSATQSNGMSNAFSVFTLYPYVRSVNSSHYVRAALEVRDGTNRVDAVGYSAKTKASVLRVGLSGDHVDGLGGGGYSMYSATLSAGTTSTTDTNDALATGARTAGSFSKISYSIARQQTLAGAWTLYGSLGGQSASKNLDGSEQTGLGGPGSVRGYGGEGGGSTGASGTLELRYSMPVKLGEELSTLSPALFFDRGWVKYYESVPTGSIVPNTRALSSYGIALTMQSQPKVPTPTSWSYFLRGMYGLHSMNASQTSAVDPSSKSKFWLQGGVNF